MAKYISTLVNGGKRIDPTIIKSIKNTNIKTIAIGGGVASNSGLRNRLKEIADKMNLRLHIPERQYCTDNAAMIAITSTYYFLRK